MDIFSTYFHNFESIDKTNKSILFIAGAGMDHRLVRSTKLPDSEYNRPLIIDLPGHGLTQGSSSNNIETYSKFLIDSLKAHDLKELSICGHSMGGLVALDMVTRQGYEAKSLILVNSIYPTRVADALLAKAKACNNYQLDLTEIKSLGIPISIILGSKDKLVDLKAVDSFANVVPSKIHTIDEVGHFPFFEDPSELSKLISSLV